MQGSYYDVLGVPPSASEEEIRARYLRLIRRYHPDRNRSPLAHARTTAINEAFHFLSDPELRAWHDAQLVVQRQEIVSARALEHARGGGGRAMVVRRRRPLLERYGARLALAALLVGTSVAGWQIEHRMLGGDAALAALASDDDSDSRAHHAVQALEAATAQEAQDMPPVSSAAVARGVGAYRRLAAAGDVSHARAFSERCQAQAADADGFDALDSCVAFDQAAFLGATRNAPSAPNAGYFVDLHDRATHLYVSRLSSLDAIDQRLDQIRGEVGPPPAPALRGTARVMHGLSKRGWTLVGEAWHAFDAPDTERRRADPQARDF